MSLFSSYFSRLKRAREADDDDAQDIVEFVATAALATSSLVLKRTSTVPSLSSSPLLLFFTTDDDETTGISSDGGYGEYVTLRSEAVLSIPEDIDPAEAAPLLCAGVTTFSTYLLSLSLPFPVFFELRALLTIGAHSVSRADRLDEKHGSQIG